MNIITGKNLISNTVAQVRANMNVVHNILKGAFVPQEKLLCAA